MLPIMVDVQSLPVAVIGNGFSAGLRLKSLKESGAEKVSVYAPDPEADVAELAGDDLARRWPQEAELTSGQFRVVFICDIPEDLTGRLHAAARAGGALINTHDQKPLCDFHMPAVLNRGDLKITVSTNGRVAGLARILRDHLRDHVVGEEWAKRVDELGAKREAWVKQRLPFSQLKANVETYIADRGWLSSKT